MGVGIRKGEGRKQARRKKGKRLKHKKLHKQWGHCLFQPVSLAGYRAATYHHDNLSGIQAKYLIINKDE